MTSTATASLQHQTSKLQNPRSPPKAPSTRSPRKVRHPAPLKLSSAEVRHQQVAHLKPIPQALPANNRAPCPSKPQSLQPPPALHCLHPHQGGGGSGTTSKAFSRTENPPAFLKTKKPRLSVSSLTQSKAVSFSKLPCPHAPITTPPLKIPCLYFNNKPE